MKNYEQMARDVLKRRDEELQISTARKSRYRFMKIAVTCCSALAVVVIGGLVWTHVGTVSNGNNIADDDLSDSGFQFQAYRSPNSKPTESMAAHSPEQDMGVDDIGVEEAADTVNVPTIGGGFDGADYDSSADLDIAIEEPVDPDESDEDDNDNIIVNVCSEFYFPEERDVSGWDYEPMTVEELCDFYKVPLNALSMAHPDWKEEHGKLGHYSKTTDDGFMVSHAIENVGTLRYVTPDGADITVIPDFGTPRDPSKAPETDKRDNSGAQTVSLPDGGMATASSPPMIPNEVGEEEMIDSSTLLGVPVTVYRNADGDYLADFQPYGSADGLHGYLRVIARGMSEDDFIDVIRCFLTTNVSYNNEEPVEMPYSIPEDERAEPLVESVPNVSAPEIATEDYVPEDGLLDDELVAEDYVPENELLNDELAEVVIVD